MYPTVIHEERTVLGRVLHGLRKPARVAGTGMARVRVRVRLSVTRAKTRTRGRGYGSTFLIWNPSTRLDQPHLLSPPCTFSNHLCIEDPSTTPKSASLAPRPLYARYVLSKKSSHRCKQDLSSFLHICGYEVQPGTTASNEVRVLPTYSCVDLLNNFHS
jgi:hypothetical protein